MIVFPTLGNAQQQVIINGKTFYNVRAIIDNGDTIPYIALREVVIMPPFKFANAKEKNRYKKLTYNIKKVYPYARLASVKMYEINAKVEAASSEYEKKRITKLEEDKLKAEFEEELKNLTMTQGKLLIKLIDRETGKSTYEIVKQLRGSLSAFFWQSLARLFGADLKDEYDAAGDDRLIEDIVIRIQNGQL